MTERELAARAVAELQADTRLRERLAAQFGTPLGQSDLLPDPAKPIPLNSWAMRVLIAGIGAATGRHPKCVHTEPGLTLVPVLARAVAIGRSVRARFA